MERQYNEDRLSAFFDGELPLNERSEMEGLLRASPEMQRALDDFQRQRAWLALLPTPALSEGFSNRVMAQVLAAAATSAAPSFPSAIPPPFPVQPKRRSFALIVTIAMSAAAMLALGLFIANPFKKPGGNPEIVTNDPPKTIDDSSTNSPEPALPDPKLNRQGDPTTIAANDPKDIGATNPSVPKEDPANNSNSIANNGSAELPSVANLDPKKDVTNANAAPSSNGILAANTANPKATMKTRPKAYRVQIGTRSEFEMRLKDAGVPFYHGKAIDPPSDATKPLRVDILPDPEYILVEGSESQLGDLVTKLQSQADLAMRELIGDDEAEFLLLALTNIDSNGVSIRPSDAKEDEPAGFMFSYAALRTLIPATLPSTKGPLPAVNNGVPAPKIQMKPVEEKREMLYVPRVIFILDVRMGEAEGKPAK